MENRSTVLSLISTVVNLVKNWKILTKHSFDTHHSCNYQDGQIELNNKKFYLKIRFGKTLFLTKSTKQLARKNIIKPSKQKGWMLSKKQM